MRLSYSTLSLFNTCPRLFHYRVEKNLVSRMYEGNALSVGSALHHAVARMYAGVHSQAAIQEALDLYDQTNKNIVDPKVADGRYQLEVSLKAYPWVAKDFDYVESIEKNLEHEILPGINFEGRIDRLVRFNTRTYIHDTKTTGLRHNDAILIQRIRMQYVGYAWLVKHVLGRTVDGVIVDLVFKPKVYRTRRGEFSSASEPAFHREPIPILQHNYDEFEEWARDTIARIHAEPRPMNTDSCYRYFRPCSFSSACLETPRNRPATLDTLYQVEEQCQNSSPDEDAF